MYGGKCNQALVPINLQITTHFHLHISVFLALESFHGVKFNEYIFPSSWKRVDWQIKYVSNSIKSAHFVRHCVKNVPENVLHYRPTSRHLWAPESCCAIRIIRFSPPSGIFIVCWLCWTSLDQTRVRSLAITGLWLVIMTHYSPLIGWQRHDQSMLPSSGQFILARKIRSRVCGCLRFSEINPRRWDRTIEDEKQNGFIPISYIIIWIHWLNVRY